MSCLVFVSDFGCYKKYKPIMSTSMYSTIILLCEKIVKIPLLKRYNINLMDRTYIICKYLKKDEIKKYS